MRKLFLAAPLLVSTALATPALAQSVTPVSATAVAPACSLAGGTTNAGSPASLTVSCNAAETLLLQTADGSAKAGTDYDAQSSVVALPFSGSVTVPIPTHVNSSAYGQTLNLSASLSLNGVTLATASLSIVDPTPISCWDGSTVIPPVACPSTNPTVGQSPGVGAPDIATTDHDVMQDIMPMTLPAYNAPYPLGDVRNKGQQGAFRFICAPTSLKYDDSTVQHGLPGQSHLHDQTGVKNWDAFSDYVSLREQGGGSRCNDVAGADKNMAEANNAANRTPYYQPALLDGKGNVIRPDLTSFYYKRAPMADPEVGDPTYAQFMGKGVPLPNGLKIVFGAFPNSPTTPASPAFVWSCVNPQGAPVATGPFPAMVQCVEAHNGPTGAGYQLNGHGSAPDCWDGVHLDSPDHRSHMAYPYDTHLGYKKCDAQHPFVVPTFTYAVDYTLLSTDGPNLFFSSDDMDQTQPRGWSFHVDYGPASWDPKILKMWTDNCINKMLNCFGGNLGNGFGLKGAQQPIDYNPVTKTWALTWHATQRLVPIPPMSTM